MLYEEFQFNLDILKSICGARKTEIPLKSLPVITLRKCLVCLSDYLSVLHVPLNNGDKYVNGISKLGSFLVEIIKYI